MQKTSDQNDPRNGVCGPITSDNRLYRNKTEGQRCNDGGYHSTQCLAINALHRTHGLYRHIDGDLAGLLEGEGQRESPARLERLLQSDQHDVVAAGLKDDGAVGGDWQAADRVRFLRGPFAALLARMAALSCFPVAIVPLRSDSAN